MSNPDLLVVFCMGMLACVLALLGANLLNGRIESRLRTRAARRRVSKLATK